MCAVMHILPFHLEKGGQSDVALPYTTKPTSIYVYKVLLQKIRKNRFSKYEYLIEP